MRHRAAAPFLEPVSEAAAPGYHSIIRQPMDLTTVLEGLESSSYSSLGEQGSIGHLICLCISCNPQAVRSALAADRSDNGASFPCRCFHISISVTEQVPR